MSRAALVAILAVLVLSTSPAAADVGVDRARTLFANGQLDEALRVLAVAPSEMHADPSLLFLKGQILARLHRFDEAIRALDEADPDGRTTNVKLVVLRGRCQLALGNRGQARHDAELAYALAPTSKSVRAFVRKVAPETVEPLTPPHPPTPVAAAPVSAAPVMSPATKPASPPPPTPSPVPSPTAHPRPLPTPPAVPSRAARPSPSPSPSSPPPSAPARLELPTERAIGTTVKLPGGMYLTYVPPGSFVMGSPGEYAGQEGPSHKVTLTKDFWIGVHEVTQAQWIDIMGSNPSQNTFLPSCPVDSVTWQECVEFCDRVSRKVGLRVRLPTEAEWEYAARAGTTGPCYGRSNAIAWNKTNADGRTHPVGMKTPNAWGLCDVLGNVSEWCGGVFYRYGTEDAVDPVGPDEGFSHAIRGGSIIYAFSTVTSRYVHGEDASGPYLGFRVVLTEHESVPVVRPKPTPQTGPDGDKVLAAAVARDWAEVRRLVEAGADITTTDEYGFGVLHLAAASGDDATVDLLLRHGADYNQHTRFFKTPLGLSLARTECSMAMVRRLVEAGADVNFNFGGCYPMKEAVLKNNAEAVAYLLERGAKIDVGIAPESMLHTACRHGCLETVRLLARGDAETRLRDNSGQTPLMAAVDTYSSDEGRAVQMCDILLAKGAQIDAVDKKGRSALHHAAEESRPLVVATLLRHGADPSLTDSTGKTALDLARAYAERHRRLGTAIIDQLERHEGSH